MNISLDDYIRGNRDDSKMDCRNMSLDEIIYMKNKKNPEQSGKKNAHNGSGVSKFDRYKHQDEGSDDYEMDEEGYPKNMPELVPTSAPKMPAKKPVRERLGVRSESVCESIHTSQMKLFRPNKFKAKASVQERLGKNYVNPAIKERNRITTHTLNEITKNNGKDLPSLIEQMGGQMIFNAFIKGIQNIPPQTPAIAEPKYDMNIQKDIAYIQGKELHYACPGAFIVSSDGPGLRGQVDIPNHQTGISMNQRFA